MTLLASLFSFVADFGLESVVVNGFVHQFRSDDGGVINCQISQERYCDENRNSVQRIICNVLCIIGDADPNSFSIISQVMSVILIIPFEEVGIPDFIIHREYVDANNNIYQLSRRGPLQGLHRSCIE